MALVPPSHARRARVLAREPPPFPADRRPRKSTISIFCMIARHWARRERRRLLRAPRASIPIRPGQGSPEEFRDLRSVGGRSAPLFRRRLVGDAADASVRAERLREQRLARRGRAGRQRRALFRRALRRTSGPRTDRARARRRKNHKAMSRDSRQLGRRRASPSIPIASSATSRSCKSRCTASR